MKKHAERDSANEEGVLPDRQPQQALVLGKGVHRVEHLDGNEDAQRHRRGAVGHHVCEHLAADLRERSRALVEVRLVESR